MFKKYKKEQQVQQPCPHKYQKDFDWYIWRGDWVDNCGNKQTTLRIKKPYVCLKCKRREDVNISAVTVPVSKAGEAIKALQDRYPKIKGITEIEETVNDFIRVDRDFLQLVESTKETNVPTINVKQEINDETIKGHCSSCFYYRPENCRCSLCDFPPMTGYDYCSKFSEK